MAHPPTSHRFLDVADWLVALAGVALAAVLLWRGIADASGDERIIFGAIFAICVWGANQVFTLTRGASGLCFSPWTGALVLGCIVLPTSLAAGLALVFLLDLQYERGLRHKMIMNAGKLTPCLLLASWSGHVVIDALPAGADLVAASMVAATVLMVTEVATICLETVMRRKPVRLMVRAAWPVWTLDIVVSIITVAVAGPFVVASPWGVLVLVALQAVAWFATHMTASESRHRSSNAYLKDVFSRYVPAHVAAALADSQEEVALGGAARDVTVLFCDIRGFTKWSDGAPPEQIVEQLNIVLGELSGAVLDADGTLDKYTGDGLMAFWGAPLAQPDHAARAVAAARSMLVRLEGVNERRAAIGQAAMHIGIGINSGTAIVGNVGHEDRLDYTAIGDTVNTAARIEAASKHLNSPLVVSASTMSLLESGDRLDLLDHGGIQLAGKADLVDVAVLRVPVEQQPFAA